MASEASLTSILQSIGGSTDGQRRVSVEDLVDAIGHRGYGPFLLVPALIEISPLGGIPALPTVLAAIVVIFAAQIVLGRKHLWLPRMLRKREIPARRMQRALDKVKPLARRMDGWFHGRLCSLSGYLGTRVAAVCCILLALTVPPLEFLPFVASAPMLAIAIFGLAITVRDGILMLVGYLAAAAAVAAGIAMAMGG